MKNLLPLIFLMMLAPAFGADETASPSTAPVFTPVLNFSTLERIAVQDGGRKKLFQTLAHEAIEELIGRPVFGGSPSLTDKASGVKLGATELFLSVWQFPEYWTSRPLVLVSYRPLRVAMGLNAEEKHFSVQEISHSKSFQELLKSAVDLRHKEKDKELTDLQKEAEIIEQRLDIFARIMSSDRILAIIPHPKRADGKWLSIKGYQESLGDSSAQSYYSPEQFDAVKSDMDATLQAYRARKPEAFAKATRELQSSLRALSPVVYPAASALELEIQYNHNRPFGWAWICYFPAAMLGLFALKYRGRGVYMAAMTLFGAGLAMHVYGFALRCLIAGRPPVSNMYESVVWVGFGAVMFGLIFELKYMRRYFMICGASAGFACLVLVDQMPVIMGNVNAPGFESQIKPLVPVLRDNFWLTIHVLTITLGYSAFMLAWFLGHVTLFSHLFRPTKRAEHHELHNFVYYALQIGVLLLACGTILGGVWAYYSWGRFWGWDPKETWAFIALMCYLFVLHGRVAGWWGNFGLSVGAVVCFQAVVMAWYGVNFVLGNGLHSYGTGAGGEAYVISAVSVDALFTIASIIRRNTFKELTERIESPEGHSPA